MPAKPAAVLPRRKAKDKRPPAHAVAFDPEPETICYRGQTLAIVRHFFEMSCQLGRLPSILGREFFRAKVSHHAVPSFEDQALFAHDVQQSLLKLDEDDLEVITLIGLYGLTYDAAGEMLHRSAGCVGQRYMEALTRLTQIFLDAGIVRRERPDRRQAQMKGRKRPRAFFSARKPSGSVHPSAMQESWEAACNA